MPRRPRQPRGSPAALPRPGAAALPNNLEAAGDKLKVYSLENLLKAKRTFRRIEPARLSDVLVPWFEKNVARPGARLEGIVDIWMAHVPEPIARHSRLVSLQRGILTVSVTHAPVRAQLEALLRQSLLRQLQAESKGAVLRVKSYVNGDFTGAV